MTSMQAKMHPLSIQAALLGALLPESVFNVTFQPLLASRQENSNNAKFRQR